VKSRLVRRGRSIEFGFYPNRLEFTSGEVSVRTIDGHEERKALLLKDKHCRGGWCYCPSKQFSSRIFGLPKPQTITHRKSTSRERMKFIVWVLSFFCGMRFSTSELGFLDATPIKSSKLVDFVLSNSSFPKAVMLAEKYWIGNAKNKMQINRLSAAFNVLYMSQNPQFLQFEEFLYLYSSLDACFAIVASGYENQQLPRTHAERIRWLCKIFSMTIPQWARLSTRKRTSKIAEARNLLVHEALLAGKPAGFGVFTGQDARMLLDLRHLICRLIVAIIAGPKCKYVKTPINTRNRHLLEL
jgi:hypothetical protein